MTVLALQRTKLEVVRIDATCPKCEQGLLSFVKEVEVEVGLYVKEPKFQHACPACGAGVLLDAAYPHNRLEPADATVNVVAPALAPVPAAAIAQAASASCCAGH